MPDLTLHHGRTVRDRPQQQRSPNRSEVPRCFEGEASSEPQILARKLHFSAAC